jgi:sulfur carrier protein
MIVIVNGISKDFAEGSTLQTVIAELGLDDKVMAAALNMEIVKQENWLTCKLSDGDKLELLDFVGGG